MQQTQRQRERHAPKKLDGYSQAIDDVVSWLIETLDDLERVRLAMKSRHSYFIGAETVLHGARKAIQRGAAKGARLRRVAMIREGRA